MSLIPSSTRSAAALPESNVTGNPPQRAVMVAGGLVALALAGALAGISPRLAVLFAIGAGCGVTLYHAAFGFTSAYRRLLVARETAGVEALDTSVLEDVTSVMNIGIILGAVLAAGLAGRFGPVARIPLRPLAAAALGGLMMGYGARIAYGCNIGAFFSGVASTSLHGWRWIATALPGCWLGVRLRPAFHLSNG